MWGAILGGLGLISNYLQGRRQNDIANRAVNAQEAVSYEQAEYARKLNELQSRLQGYVQSAEGAGLFDADAERARAFDAYSEFYGRTARDTAAAQRVMGYKPGDSVPIEQSARQRDRFAREWARTSGQFGRDLLNQRLAAYAATNPALIGQASGILGESGSRLAGAYGARAGMMGTPDVGQGLMALMPYLQSLGGGGRGGGSGLGNLAAYDKNSVGSLTWLPGWVGGYGGGGSNKTGGYKN